MSALSDYRDSVEQEMATGQATEHTYRPALKALIEALEPKLHAINEPTRVECGAPDYVVARTTGHGPVTLGYVEAKDIGVPLDAVEKTDQLGRYFGSLTNLVLTDYLEFRWYVDGEPRTSARLAHRSDDRLAAVGGGDDEVESLLRDFIAHSPGAITRPEQLARRLARLTHMVRDIIVAAFKLDAASDTLRDLQKVFTDVLIPNLTVEQYADMFAQTLAYGLFAARINHDQTVPFTRELAATDIPPANPFLRRFFTTIAGPDLDDEPFVGFVDDIAQLLSDTDMDAVLKNFGHATRHRDPVFHFYETFLSAYDPDVRDRRGVWFTPQSVVGYIVRSVDDVLRERFDCETGLADRSRVEYTRLDEDGNEQVAESPRVLVLDPAVGTGTFLYAVVDLIRERFRERDNAGRWPAYVREHLLPRLFGFEYLMAPYAVAHLKLGLQLAAADLPERERADWAYTFGHDERLGVYLTNTLEQARRQTTLPIGRFISDEANAATDIKRDLPIMVVLGNPPYQGQSSNPSVVEVKDVQTGRIRRAKTFIGELHEDYYKVDGKPLGERNPKWVGDDYAKFIRFGQWRIERSGAGVLAFITNHNYLDAPTFRGMRQQLMGAFSDIYVLDLHGRSVVPRSPGGDRDRNIFDIERGVSVGIFIKRPGSEGPACVWHADLWGERAHKDDWLDANSLSSTEWARLAPTAPYYRFVPVNADREDEYLKGWKLTEAMPVFNAGMVTGRDKVAVAFSEDELWSVLQDFAKLPVADLRAKYPLPAVNAQHGDWSAERAKAELGASPPDRTEIASLLYRPFDYRFTYLAGRSGGFLVRPRADLMHHMRHKDSLGLISARSNNSSVMDHFLVSDRPTEAKAGEASIQSHLFPLYLFPPEEQTPEEEGRLDLESASNPKERRVNFKPEFTADVAGRLELPYSADSPAGERNAVGARDIFNYAYAVLNAPSYRDRYAEFLRKDFPHLPLTTDARLFFDLADLGADLVELHLLRSAELEEPKASYPVPGADVVEEGHPRYVAPGETPPEGGEPLLRGHVYLSKSNKRRGVRGQYFEGVTPEVWYWEVGGRQPARDWLYARRGRKLAEAELDHYDRLLTAIACTLVVVDDIEARVPCWPLP
jgi:Type ISP C-terminal specificity domain